MALPEMTLVFRFVSKPLFLNTEWKTILLFTAKDTLIAVDVIALQTISVQMLFAKSNNFLQKSATKADF